MAHILLGSWNVFGLTDSNRKYLVRNWLNSLGKPMDVLMLQEIKVGAFKLDTTLRFILPGYTTIIAHADHGKGGTAVLVHPEFNILESRTFANGRVAWAKIDNKRGTFYIGCIYAPNSSPERKTLWNTLQNTLPRENWIITGDFNMTEGQSDSTSLYPLLSGTEQEEWMIFKLRFALKDAISLTNLQGPLFTRRGNLQGIINQSRLDQFYISDNGNWLENIESLRHHTTTILSDHDPITINVKLLSNTVQNPDLKRSSYLKANETIVQKPANLELLKNSLGKNKLG
jgi:exonuclease III